MQTPAQRTDALRADLAEAVALLWESEWAGDRDGDPSCIFCMAYPPDAGMFGHASNCTLSAFLAKHAEAPPLRPTPRRRVMGRAHCWEGEEDHIPEQERLGREADQHFEESAARPFGMCVLWDGHAGPHEWTDPSEIRVTFKEPSPTPGGDSDG